MPSIQIVELEDKFDFERGDKVLFLPDRRVYDFGYWGQIGKAIIYNEGECNLQDAIAVNPSDLIKIRQ